MDDATGFIWSYFLRYKSQVKDKMVELIKHLDRKHGYNMKYLRYEMLGRISRLRKNATSKDWELPLSTLHPTLPNRMEEWKGSLQRCMAE